MTALPDVVPAGQVDSSILARWASHITTFPPPDVERTALRHRSLAFRQVLAHAATGGALSYDDLSATVLDPRGRGRGESLRGVLDPTWTSSLAMVVGVQELLPTDTDLAVGLYHRLVTDVGESALDDRHRGYLAELLLARGEQHAAARVVQGAADPDDASLRHLRLDTTNPYVAGDEHGAQAWSRGFGELFAEHDLEPPSVLPGPGAPFDRLVCRPRRSTGSGPLVSVVLTTYRPDAALLSSLGSILDQTWTNLEVLVVDDASPAEYDPVLDQVEGSDPRVRLLRRRENGGTYLARNDGLAAAGGLFVTGQDDDDWSHPQRIERQVAALLADETRPAVRSHMLTVSPDLVFHRRGIPPRRVSQISLMYRRELGLRVGGFAPARRSADVELAERLHAVTGRSVQDLREPLMLARIQAGSLSRADFRGGWHHPARLAMRASWNAWHHAIRAGADPVPRPDGPGLQVPRRYRIAEAGPASYDVVLLGDWRTTRSDLEAGLDRARGLAERGLTVGLWQVDDPWQVRGGTPTFARPVAELANEGLVDLVVPDDPGSAAVLVVEDPAVLQFLPSTPVALQVDDVVVLEGAPSTAAPDGTVASEPRYAADDCAASLQRLVGRPVSWSHATAAPRTRSGAGPVLTTLAALERPE